MAVNDFRPLSFDGLADMARVNRVDTANMFMACGNGHFGSCYSCTEIVTALYFALMRVDAANPGWPDRDRFILGKGHAAPTLYSALIRRGFMPEEWIGEFENIVGARLMTHPSKRYQAGVDASQGALGHGLSIGVGIALAGRLDGRDYNTYVLLGDGETNEGSVWEAAMSAAKLKLGTLTAIIDANRLCVDGWVDDVMPVEPLVERWESFGWDVTRLDGHDFNALLPALEPRRDTAPARPRMVIADTVKGKGVSFMENERRWHADVISPQDYRRVMDELNGAAR